MTRWFNRITIAASEVDLSEDLKKHIHDSNLVSLIFGLIALTYGLIFALNHAYEMALLTIPIACFFWLTMLLNKMRLYTPSRLLICVTLNCAVYIYSTTFGRTSGIHFWFFPAMQIPFLLFGLREKIGLATSTLFSVALFLFLWSSNFKLNLLPLVNSTPNQLQFISATMISLSFIISLLIVYYIAHDYLRISNVHDMNFAALDKSSIVAFTDISGKITYSNAKFREISGYSNQELIGKTHSIVNSGHHPAQFFEVLWSTILSSNIWEGEICNKAKDGRLYWVYSTIIPMTSAEGKIEQFAVIRHDITQRKQAEQKSFEASRLTSLGEMSAGMAHEINNPVAVIQGKAAQLLKLVRNKQATPEKSVEQLEKIIYETERIAKIIKGLQTFSRDGTKDAFKSVELSALFDDVLGLCQERFKNAQVKLEIKPFPKIVLDARAIQLVQVFLNLLNNSFDAISSTLDKWIRIDVSQVGERIQIAFIDSGIGVPPEITDKLMQPFFTTKEVGKGTGLGLSISKGIIEDHGGQLSLDKNSPNTKFIIELPRQQKLSHDDGAAIS